MSFNFFSWLREGVRQSVLLGVSDAVTHLGTPHDGDNVQQRLTSFLRQEGNTAAPLPGRPSGGERRKLGRSLQDIQAGVVKPA
jgi:hypothetical protein